MIFDYLILCSGEVYDIYRLDILDGSVERLVGFLYWMSLICLGSEVKCAMTICWIVEKKERVK